MGKHRMISTRKCAAAFVLVLTMVVGCDKILLAQAGSCPQECAIPPVVTPDPFSLPFAPDSIWNRPIPTDAVFADISNAIFGDPGQIITRLGLDIVTLCYSEPSAPLVQIEKNLGWQYPDRACSSGTVLYTRHLAPDACIGVSWVRRGNAAFIIIDPATGLEQFKAELAHIHMRQTNFSRFEVTCPLMT